ncbi:hypothetical protein GGI25_000309 [Coemansia spiralis]|uniref:CCHC-type domain-containing protein n=2 Tax=Coemansia TaxID=4863 RepID=A0A9W8GFA5_9FUNG|nr:hypothetical protein EDC05_000474 [Coemansia umbellata]KAJ2625880.1 hypothetical protein GGI26_000343 [Coemansia sp. RSA 1358]KAJ2681003.1 hypothetical protein GGI25_000309 [Coemansia spiralis]
MPNLAKEANAAPETETTIAEESALSQNQISNNEPNNAEHKCKLCNADSDFLLYLEFSPEISASVRLQIERFIKRTLGSDGSYAEGRPCEPLRKRRRRDDSRDRGRYDRYYEYNRSLDDGSDRSAYNSDSNTATSSKRKRGLSEDTGPNGLPGSSLIIYGRDVGYNVDTTRDNEFDAGILNYNRGTTSILGLVIDPLQAQGNACFNCSMHGHELRDCPMPFDKEQVEENRNAFREKGLGQFNSRLYLVVEEEKHAEELRKKYRPGQPLSQELHEALGLKSENDVPEYIESMYCFGYPPAYLGNRYDQDPMLARGILDFKPQPPSPEPLHVYSNAGDYSTAEGKNELTGVSVPTATNSYEEGSDEEGAIDEGELDEEGKKQSTGDRNETNTPNPTRNIPLVKYPGLDLAEFDFSSLERPGKPLRRHPVHQRTQQSSLVESDGYSQPLYNSPYYQDTYYRQGHTDERINKHSDNPYYGYYQDSAATANNAYTQQNGYEFNAMLERYYQNTHPTNANDRASTYYSQATYADLPPQPSNPQPPLSLPPVPPADAQKGSISIPQKDPEATHKQTASPCIPMTGGDEGSNVDLEDGECDMEESD